jgi:hypothetical protein
MAKGKEASVVGFGGNTLNLEGKRFRDLTVIGDTGNRTSDYGQLVIARDDDGNLHDNIVASELVRQSKHLPINSQEFSKLQSEKGKKGQRASMKSRDLTRPQANCKTGIRGVYFDSKTGVYRAKMNFKGREVLNMSSSKIEMCIAARKAAERKYLGGN